MHFVKKLITFSYDVAAWAKCIHTLLPDGSEASFFDLSERVSYRVLMKRLVAVTEVEQPEYCLLIPRREKGITFRDYLIGLTLDKCGGKVMAYCPERMRTAWWNRWLERLYFRNRTVLIADWRDYQKLCGYTEKKNIFVCPEVNGREITVGDFNRNLTTALTKV